MSNETHWRCPSCTGEFPDHALDDGCPWCGQELGDAGPKFPVKTTTISKEKDADSPSFFKGLFGPWNREDS